ncbi:kelch-like protein 17 isoform X4 [Callithrix jacchus]
MEGAVQLLSREGHSVAHNSKRHYHDAFVAMSRMRQRGLLCDIVLHVAAKEIRAHKVVLASCSPYFHAMFTNEMSESRQTHVTLHDIDPQALDQLVQFAYTAEIVVGEGNVQTLLPAASLLQLNGVRDACCKFLLSQLDPSNCLGIRGFADAHSCSDLLKAAHRYVLQHFVDVAKTEEFMLLPLKQVLELVSSDSLNVPSEEEVYRAVLSWVKHDVDARRQHVPRLMKCVRLPLLSRDFLLGHVDAESLVRHHPDCKDLLIEALKFHLLPEQRGVLGTSRTRPRRCEGAGPVLFAVGGGSLFAIHGDCEAYDTRTDRWHMVASMSTRRARVGVAAVGNRLYAVGGYDGTSDLATVESYDPVTNTWQPEVSMGTRRSCLGVAALHGLLYSAGGYDGASCLNRWEPVRRGRLRQLLTSGHCGEVRAPGAHTTWWPWMDGCTQSGATMAAPASTPSRSTTRGPTSGWLPPACSPGAAAWASRCWSCSTFRHHPRPRSPCPPPASDPATARVPQPPTCLKGAMAPTRDALHHLFASSDHSFLSVFSCLFIY